MAAASGGDGSGGGLVTTGPPPCFIEIGRSHVDRPTARPPDVPTDLSLDCSLDCFVCWCVGKQKETARSRMNVCPWEQLLRRWTNIGVSKRT